MTLIIIGIIVFFAALAFKNQNQAVTQLVKPVRIFGILLVLIGFFTSCIKQIDAG